MNLKLSIPSKRGLFHIKIWVRLFFSGWGCRKTEPFSSHSFI